MNLQWRGTALGASIVVLLLVAGEPRSKTTYLLAASPREAVAVSAVGPIGMTVSNMELALEFYTRVMPFEKVSEVELAGREFELLVGVFGARARTVTLQLGRERLTLTEFLAPRGRSIPSDFRPNDIAFQHMAIIVSDMAQAYARLRSHGVAYGSSGPQRLPEWNKNVGGIEAFYFRDPDGHFLEILHFPPGKGAERWQQNGPLFLGIDHTAIVS